MNTVSELWKPNISFFADCKCKVIVKTYMKLTVAASLSKSGKLPKHFFKLEIQNIRHTNKLYGTLWQDQEYQVKPLHKMFLFFSDYLTKLFLWLKICIPIYSKQYTILHHTGDFDLSFFQEIVNIGNILTQRPYRSLKCF